MLNLDIKANENENLYKLNYKSMSYNEADLAKAVEAVFKSYDADNSGTLEAQ